MLYVCGHGDKNANQLVGMTSHSSEPLVNVGNSKVTIARQNSQAVGVMRSSLATSSKYCNGRGSIARSKRSVYGPVGDMHRTLRSYWPPYVMRVMKRARSIPQGEDHGV